MNLKIILILWSVPPRVTASIGLNNLDPDLDQNKHRINLEWVTAKIGLNGLDPDIDQDKHRINLE